MLDTTDWKFFTIEEIFEKIDSTKGTTTDILVNGNEVPYICASKINNGFDYMVARDGNEEFISKGNCVVLVQIGAGGAGYATYQDADFIGMSGKTVACYTKFLNKKRGLFLSTVLSQERFRYCYGRSWTGSRLRNTKVRLPVTSNSEIDWEWIDSYMHSIDLSAPISQNLSKNNKVETENWKKFKLGELFEIETGTDLIYQDQIEGGYPVVGHNESNNGVTCLIQKVEGRRLYDHNITISLGDRGCFIAYVQPRDFYIGTRVKALISKFKEANIYNLQFVSTLINQEHFKFCYGRNATSKIPEIVIKLPVKNTDEPDWQFMENYIKSLPYGDCI